MTASTTRICDHCSAGLPEAQATGRPRRYCDPTCRHAAWHARGGATAKAEARQALLFDSWGECVASTIPSPTTKTEVPVATRLPKPWKSSSARR
jgi:hypothetical protein